MIGSFKLRGLYSSTFPLLTFLQLPLPPKLLNSCHNSVDSVPDRKTTALGRHWEGGVLKVFLEGIIRDAVT